MSGTTAQTTIADICNFLLRSSECGQILEENQISGALSWPPDVFCICAAILKHSGAYTWLPIASIHSLREEGEKAGRRWRESIDASFGKGSGPMQEVKDIWDEISPHEGSPIA